MEEAQKTATTPNVLKFGLPITIGIISLSYYAFDTYIKYKRSKKLLQAINSWNDNAALNGFHLTAIPNYAFSRFVYFSPNCGNRRSRGSRGFSPCMALDFFSAQNSLEQNQVLINESYI